MSFHSGELKLLLDVLVEKYNRREFIADDPVVIPHQYTKKEDIEIAGFLTAIMAWGSRKAIMKAAFGIMERMDNEPFDFISNHSASDLSRFNKFVYRTLQPNDLRFFIRALQNVYRNHGGLETLFCEGMSTVQADMYQGICRARSILLQTDHEARVEKHLANPDAGSSAKRINLFLRWMVRSDQHGVDFGLWKGIKPAMLICPLDIHTGNSARNLGLISRKANDKVSALELTQRLKEFDPSDPIKYDFALFGLGRYGD
jgi:uncharacterized protein (TIGR02757 family)